jgi:hypothetical protein
MAGQNPARGEFRDRLMGGPSQLAPPIIVFHSAPLDMPIRVPYLFEQ